MRSLPPSRELKAFPPYVCWKSEETPNDDGRPADSGKVRNLNQLQLRLDPSHAAIEIVQTHEQTGVIAMQSGYLALEHRFTALEDRSSAMASA